MPPGKDDWINQIHRESGASARPHEVDSAIEPSDQAVGHTLRHRLGVEVARVVSLYNKGADERHRVDVDVKEADILVVSPGRAELRIEIQEGRRIIDVLRFVRHNEWVIRGPSSHKLDATGSGRLALRGDQTIDGLVQEILEPLLRCASGLE